MDQATMLSIVGGMYDKLVSDVSDAAIRKLKAEGQATAALDPETLASSLTTLLQREGAAREAVRDIALDCIDGMDLDDNSAFSDLKNKVESIDAIVIDADDSDFDAAVMQVLRNNI